ncbi:MAG: hypothetical protein NZ518_09445 [Dehalococcoidia bacterium]|nr:hypothetical protein [Dehalococcoidia bacterium]
MDRVTLALALAVVGLVVGAVAAVALIARAPSPPDETSPRGVVIAYLHAVDRGEYERAYGYLASTVTRTLTVDAYERELSRWRDRPRRLDVGPATIRNGTAVTSVTWVYRNGLFASASSVTWEARLIQENGVWRLTRVPHSASFNFGESR